MFKTLIIFVVAILIGAICHANLPPNEIGDVDITGREGKLAGLLDKILRSQTVAEWEFSDYGVVKFARSKRLDATLIGYPFCKWQVYEPEEKKEGEK